MTSKERALEFLRGHGFCRNCKYRIRITSQDHNFVYHACLREENREKVYQSDRIFCDLWAIEDGNGVETLLSGSPVYVRVDQDFLLENIGKTIEFNLSDKKEEKSVRMDIKINIGDF